MFDEQSFDENFYRLVDEGHGEKAEELLLKAYSELKAANDVRDLEYVVGQLALFYSLPDTENLGRAKSYFLENEVLAPGAGSKRRTALFYFDILRDFQETVRKVDEIRPLEADRDSYYSALTLKGQALIKLEMLVDAKNVLEELLNLIKTNPRGLPYGDEMNLLQAAIPIPILTSTCLEILALITPKIRSKEYQERAKALAKPGDFQGT
jgi:hypothetical protein